MLKSIRRTLCALLALLLAGAALVALAESEQDTFVVGYEKLDAKEHFVYTETWEYPIVDGERGSGRPVDEDAHTEPHEFEDGVCVCCGYVEGSPEPESTVTPEDIDTGEPEPIAPPPDITSIGGGAAYEDEDGAEDDGAEEDGDRSAATAAPAVTFTTLAGATVTRGDSAAAVLKAVFAALPAGTQVTVVGVEPELAAKLLDLMAQIDAPETPQALLALLADFPVQAVDGADCHVVTLAWTDAAGQAVTENYAFRTADATLAKVY